MNLSTRACAITLLVLLTGCIKSMIPGVGIIAYDSRDSSALSATPTTPTVYDIECVDTFVRGRGRTVSGSRAGSYSVACTYQGGAMPWRVAGVFHAAPLAKGRWAQYRENVIAKAGRQGCPAIAVRVAPPTQNQEGEAIGAFCVQG